MFLCPGLTESRESGQEHERQGEVMQAAWSLRRSGLGLAPSHGAVGLLM
jgi:hypothetical protein